ncbi:MAG: septal ring lytic transglycosylase RlpA family protein [Gammaproteobacteria bacterium]
MKPRALFFAILPLLASCGAPSYTATITEEERERPPAETPDGKYYLDDGPPDFTPEDLAAVADAVPKAEKIIAATTRPYTALGKKWTPHAAVRPYRERGIASWYGKRYHGRPTASGEIYDMFKMTAAHPLLAIPSYARVTRADTGASVVVRINDRGPFLRGRVIDLSFAAAHRLGLAKKGAGEVVVEAIVPDGIRVDNSSAAAAQTAPPEQGAPSESFAAEFVYIQLGAFSVSENAEKQRRRLQNALPRMRNTIYRRDDLYLLLIGPYSGEEEARADDGELCAAGWCGFLTRAPSP